MPRHAAYLALLLIPSAVATAARDVPSTLPANDAAPAYAKAGQIIEAHKNHAISCPGNSLLTYRPYPPFGADWVAMEKADYAAGGEIRDLAHRGSTIDRADWPTLLTLLPDKQNRNGSYLSTCRRIANELVDAALYESLVLNDQPAAFASMRDCKHLADLLEDPRHANILSELVADGITELYVDRLNVIVSGVVIATGSAHQRSLPAVTARNWITLLLDHPIAEERFVAATEGEFRVARLQYPEIASRLQFLATAAVAGADTTIALKHARLADADRDMAAMSLAAHLYQLDHRRWPANANELATEMPALPIDPFGDGKQTLGYVLIPHGLPDGGDRPLVYCRCDSKNGLFFRSREPEYSYYIGDGSGAAMAIQKHGGQFRDVARWVPRASPAGPTTRPLQP